MKPAKLFHSITFANLLAFFGNEENKIIANHLRDLSKTAVECSKKLSDKGSLRESHMIEFEHRGDAAVRQIKEALERAFIVRFGKAGLTRLAHELDDVIDGMRDVARLIEEYNRFIDPFPRSAEDLVPVVQECVADLGDMVSEFVNGRVDRTRLNGLADRISEAERHADRIRAEAERDLVTQEEIPDFRMFIAQNKLNELLERMTDDAKHCAVLILAMARQEA